jgi:hypothetical protein
MDKQLCRVLQQKVFHLVSVLLECQHIICTSTTNLFHCELIDCYHSTLTKYNSSYCSEDIGIDFLVGDFVTGVDVYGVSYDDGVQERDDVDGDEEGTR